MSDYTCKVIDGIGKCIYYNESSGSAGGDKDGFLDFYRSVMPDIRYLNDTFDRRHFGYTATFYDNVNDEVVKTCSIPRQFHYASLMLKDWKCGHTHLMLFKFRSRRERDDFVMKCNKGKCDEIAFSHENDIWRLNAYFDFDGFIEGNVVFNRLEPDDWKGDASE